MLRILAIIPARGGSSGVPLKNIRMLDGIPLIVHTISAAKNSKQIDKIIVSTDNERIAKISKSAGAEVPFIRPKKISKPSSSTIEVVEHALKFLSSQSYVPKIVLILQPTSPLRTTKLIDKSIELLKRSKASCVLEVVKIKTHPYGSFRYTSKYLEPFKTDFKKFNQRQKYPNLYYPTGSIYTFWNKTLKKYHSIYGSRIKPLIVDEECYVDIDTKFDFFVAEMKILYWKKYNKKF